MQNQYSQFLHYIKIENLIYSQGQWSFWADGEEGKILTSKGERLQIIYNGSLRTAEGCKHEAKNDIQEVGYTIAHCLRSSGLGYPKFDQAIVAKCIPQFKIFFHSKPKTNTAKALVEYLQNFFASRKDIGTQNITKFQEIIDQYVQLSYGKVNPPYTQRRRNYQWHWVNIRLPEGEPSFCDWALDTLYVYENERIAQNSGPVLFSIAPIIWL